MSTRNRILLLLVVVGTLSVYGYSFALSTTKDRPDQLDTAPVKSAASAACLELRAGLDALPALAAGAGSTARLARLAEQDRLLRRLVSQIRSVGPAALARDVPAQAWLTDWETLADSRLAYANAGGTGRYVPPTGGPTTGGPTTVSKEPLTARMGRVGVPSCTVPAALTTGP